VEKMKKTIESVGSIHIVKASISVEQIKNTWIYFTSKNMSRAEGTLVVLWPIIHGLKPMATTCLGPMALKESYVEAK
jgi:hypothetical protein